MQFLVDHPWSCCQLEYCTCVLWYFESQILLSLTVLCYLGSHLPNACVLITLGCLSHCTALQIEGDIVPLTLSLSDDKLDLKLSVIIFSSRNGRPVPVVLIQNVMLVYFLSPQMCPLPCLLCTFVCVLTQEVVVCPTVENRTTSSLRAVSSSSSSSQTSASDH